MSASSVWGNNIKISIFGESHSKAIGIVIDGLPAGEEIDRQELLKFISRRSSRGGNQETARIEADVPEIQSGLLESDNGWLTCGTPVCAIIQNNNTKSSDYDKLNQIARPGHADFTGAVRYDGYNDIRGGGHFSGRLTAPLVFAGGICKQILRRNGIEIGAHIASIAGISDSAIDSVNITSSELLALQNKFFPVFDDAAGEKMQAAIALAKSELDSVGGVIECAITGLPAGVGEPMFGCIESSISSIVFGIPAVKGIEFGEGFNLANMRGSQSNDAFIIKNNTVCTSTNNNGGILGGITNGMPIIFRAVVKPTPSIAKEQNTVNFITKSQTKIKIHGRHDPCILRRAVPCIEAAAAVAILNLL